MRNTPASRIAHARRAAFIRFRKLGHRATDAWRDSLTVARFGECKVLPDVSSPPEVPAVRIRAIPEEESYFSVFGEPDDKRDRAAMVDILDTYGCWTILSEAFDPLSGEWTVADSLGMNTGYHDPASPFENAYVPDMMRAALALMEEYQSPAHRLKYARAALSLPDQKHARAALKVARAALKGV